MKKFFYVLSLLIVSSMVLPACGAFTTYSYTKSCGNNTTEMSVNGLEITGADCDEDALTTSFKLKNGDSISVELTGDKEGRVLEEVREGTNPAHIAECRLEKFIYQCEGVYSFTVEIQLTEGGPQ